MEARKIVYKSMGRGELAECYGVCLPTLNKRIKEFINFGKRRIMNPKEVRIIVAELGDFPNPPAWWPPSLVE